MAMIVFWVDVANLEFVSRDENWLQCSLCEKRVDANLMHLEEFSRLLAHGKGAVQNPKQTNLKIMPSLRISSAALMG